MINLEAMRKDAGLTAREVARQLDIHHSTVLHWEQTGKVAKTEFLLPMAKILDVNIEELLGQPRPQRFSPGGKLGMVFSEVAQLPRRQQQKVIEMAEGFIALHQNAAR